MRTPTRVLILAPQTFFCERGTPISEENLIRVMSARGWQVDILTFAQGEDIELPGVRIFRIPRLPGISDVPAGFSGRKIACDIAMFWSALDLVRRNDYDLLHGLEEAVFIAAAIRKLRGIPYVYDMDSVLSEQLINRFPGLVPFLPGLRYAEEVVVTDALAVVAVCDALARSAEELSTAPAVFRLEDRTQLGPRVDGVDSLRDIAGEGKTIALYVGNFELYQGIDLLLEGFARASAGADDLALVLIGGSEQNLRKYGAQAEKLGVSDRVHFLGPRPVGHLRSYLEQADMLVSPRISGTNTPMKVYSFLDAGVPLLATRLWTHLQVLDDQISCLFDPDPDSLAEALVRMGNDEEARERIAAAAAQRVAEFHSVEAYERRANEFLEVVEAGIDR
jgi:glycosyltransferase involved in cell wall biosynthesis